MRKIWLNVLMVSAIILISISFMAASCTVTPGPGMGYSVRIENNLASNIYIELYGDSYFSTVFANGARTISNISPNTLFRLHNGFDYFVFPTTGTINLFVDADYIIEVGSGVIWVSMER